MSFDRHLNKILKQEMEIFEIKEMDVIYLV